MSIGSNEGISVYSDVKEEYFDKVEKINSIKSSCSKESVDETR
ncbi:19075_t:CDS:2 [Gigaspora margarita]|uniref:19075_t:CDS:1 n=1 Tax=Gigaspora margarita TaxID=4874 RepID=A0ABM8W3Z5_GIGMA|nr:19075_t:CDS:2 [Gigaspora margarita]